MNKNKPPTYNDMSDIIKVLFDEKGVCRVSNKMPYIVILFLSFIALDGYKIIICHSKDYIPDSEFKLLDNGNLIEKIDNLPNIFRKKHILRVPNKPDFSFTTSMRNYRNENSKYSYFLINLCQDLFAIEHISYEKMSEIINLFYWNRIKQTERFLHNR